MSPEKLRRTFISYSRTNRDFALSLAKELRSSGFDIWLDQLDIPTGSRWDDEVEHALEECEIFMVILTPDSISSNNVKDEIGYAIDNNKRILPVLLQNATVPFRLRRFQYVDFTSKSFDEGIESAKQLLSNLISQSTIPRESISSLPQKQESGVDVQSSAATEAERLKQKTEEDWIARSRAETERKAKEESERLAIEKALVDRKAHEEAEKLAKQKPESERSTKDKHKAIAAPVSAAQPRPTNPVKRDIRAGGSASAPGSKAGKLKTRNSKNPLLKLNWRSPLALGVAGAFVVVILVFAAMSRVSESNNTPLAIGSPAETSAGTLPTGTPKKESTQTEQITETPQSKPTSTAMPTAEATQIPTLVPTESGPAKYFATVFSADFDNSAWEQISKGGGDQKKISVSPSDDGLEFKLNDNDLFVIYIYKPAVYEDVAIRLKTENLGQNAYNISLMCRRTGDTWYEFRINGGGTWKLYTYNSGYFEIGDGGATPLKIGKFVNEFEMICVGKEISLKINGELLRTVPININPYTEGQVGFNISSSTVPAIDIRVSEFEVSEP